SPCAPENLRKPIYLGLENTQVTYPGNLSEPAIRMALIINRSTTENVSVCVRIRPITSSPLSDIDLDTPTSLNRAGSQQENRNKFGAWSIDRTQSSISLSPSHPIIDRRGTGTSESIHGSEGYEFKLDQIIDPYSTTGDLYRSSVESVVESCIKDGYNATVFAYGQTGSGKTFTMLGSKDDGDDETLGVIPRASLLSSLLIWNGNITAGLYLEIYNEALKDLLATDHQSSGTTNRLTIHENKGRVHVNGIKEEVVTHPMQVLEALTRGEKARHVGATDWNERSSRSHTVFTMTIESRSKSTASATETSPTQISQLNLIDLAGSESAASSTERRKEGAFINKSLLAYQTKLTRLLQTSLSGNAKVVVICAISADARSVVETLSTLRSIIDDKSALLQAYQREITSLKAQLQENSQALSITTTSVPALAELNAEKSKAESELTGLRFERIRLQEQIEHLNRRILTSHTIESNVRRANSLQGSAPSNTRRIVSGQTLRPPKKNRGRVTDVGGMLGMLGIGLSASTTGYLPNGTKLNEDNRAQFQRELQLEKELEAVRNELESLKRKKTHTPDQLSPSGIDLLKQQIQALESDKENLPVGMTEENGIAMKIKTLEDEIETMGFEHRQTVDSNQAEIESLKTTISSLQKAKETELEELQSQLTSGFQEQEDSLKKTLHELEESSRSKLSEAESVTITLRTQLAANEQRIKELATTIEDTQSQDLEKRLEILQSDYDQLKLTHQDLLQGSQSKISTLEAELNSVKKEKGEIEAHQHETEATISNQQAELSCLRTKKDESMLAMEAQIARLESEKSDFQSKVAELQSQLETNSSLSKQEYDESISSQREQILKLETEKAEIQQRADDTHSQLTSELTTDSEDLQVAQQQQQQALQELISRLEDEKTKAYVQIEELQAQLEAELARVRKENEEVISTQTEQIAQLETDKTTTLAQVAELQSRLDTQVNFVREHETALSLQKETIASLELELSATRAKVEELKSQTPIDTTRSLGPEVEDDATFKLQIAQLEAARSDAEAKHETLKSTLESELEALRKEKEDRLSAQQEQMDHLQAGRLEADTRFRELESSWNEKSDRMLAMEKQIEQLESERSQAREQMEKLKTAFESDIESVHKDKEEYLSSQKETHETSGIERSEAQGKVEEMVAAHVSEAGPDQDQVNGIADLEAELSEAQRQIGDLTLAKNEKEQLVQTLQSRISALETELSEVGGKVEELLFGKATAEEDVRKAETASTAQVKTLEAEIKNLKDSLEDERTARVLDGEKVKSLVEELASVTTRQTDTATFATKLERLEQRLSVERNKSQEKELEVMQLIQARDRAQAQVKELGLFLNEQNTQAEENVKLISSEWESKVKQAEGQPDLKELRQANEVQAKKLEMFQREAARLEVDLEKMKTERAGREIHQEKLERLSARTQEDLKQELIKKIDTIVREKCEVATSRLHEDYNSKLVHLEESNSKLEAHIKGLESHLDHRLERAKAANYRRKYGDYRRSSKLEDGARGPQELFRCPSTSIDSNKRADHDHYHQSTEDELNRLYHIIDQQEKRLSDAKTDLSKWQARVRSQTELISKLKISPEADSEPTPTIRLAPNRSSTAACDHFPNFSSNPTNITFTNLNSGSQAKPAGLSPLLGGARSPAAWQNNHHHMLSSSTSSSSNLAPEGRSPRPLPVPQSFIASNDDDDAKRRRERRRTIEKDMAKLKDETSSLLSSSQFRDLPIPNQSQESKLKAPGPPSRFKVSSSPLVPNNPTLSTNMSRNHSHQSGQASPTPSSFSSSSQRGYYE
ncbi:hypothetical protein PSHT_10413, partial [Puccinia striiformis]